MNIVLVSATSNGEYLAGQAAAICTRSDNYKNSLHYALEGGHESVIEHVNFTFRIDGVSRALLAQLTRHRIASYSVESQRCVDMGMMPVVEPESIAKNPTAHEQWERLMKEIMLTYHRFQEMGIPKEDARYITPEAAETAILVTMNARELKHLFSLRCCNRAQWEIRQAADTMLEICKYRCPEIFKDAGPGCVRGQCPEGKKACGNPRAQDELFRKKRDYPW